MVDQMAWRNNFELSLSAVLDPCRARMFGENECVEVYAGMLKVNSCSTRGIRVYSFWKRLRVTFRSMSIYCLA